MWEKSGLWMNEPPKALKVYTCVTNGHTKVVSLSVFKPFPIIVECYTKEECSYKMQGRRPGRFVCSQSGQIDERTFVNIERRNSVPRNPA